MDADAKPAYVKSVVTVVERETIDFVEILRYLASRGFGQNSIALHTNIPRSSVRDYIRGTTPLHPQGERIIRFWCEISGFARVAAPVKREGSTITVSRF